MEAKSQIHDFEIVSISMFIMLLFSEIIRKLGCEILGWLNIVCISNSQGWSLTQRIFS